ncbi:MAG: hypothetical protein ACXACA_03835, partial [Candidatus Ranarchaeia archaeon]
MPLKIDIKLVTSLIYLLFGIIDLVIFAISKILMVHMGVLGLLSMISCIGLFLRIHYLLWLAVALAPVTISVGISTVYSSINLLGFNPNTQVLLINLGLICYIVGGFISF